jgi:hypothetical protein
MTYLCGNCSEEVFIDPENLRCKECADAELKETVDALRSVDSILARRPDLDNLPSRAAKIEHAINTAKKYDAADAELKRLRESSEIVLIGGNVTTYAAEPCPSCKPIFNENKRLREAVLCLYAHCNRTERERFREEFKDIDAELRRHAKEE